MNNLIQLDEIYRGPGYADIAGSMRDYLRQACATREINAKFLNTLAYIEHRGSRYLILSNTRESLDSAALEHIVEEARHAQIFRKMAEKIWGGPMTFADRFTLAPTAAKMYFSRLVAGITRHFRRLDCPLQFPYLYVSGTIEVRALWLYHMYHQVFTETSTGLSLQMVIKEEVGHLRMIDQRLRQIDPQLAVHLPQFLRYESQLYQRFFQRVMQESVRQAQPSPVELRH